LFAIALIIFPLTIVCGVLYFGLDGLGATRADPVLDLALFRLAEFLLLSGISSSQPRVVAVVTVYFVINSVVSVLIYWIAGFQPLITARADAGCAGGSGAPVCVASLAQFPLNVASVLTLLVGGVYLCTTLRRRCTSLVRIEALWLTYSRVLTVSGIILLIRLLVRCALLPEWSLARIEDRADLVGVHQIVLGLVASSKRTRELFSRLLVSTVRQLTPAVCLSLFFGGESEEAILASAQQLFKAIPASAIRLEELLSVEPIVSMAVKPTSLGSCDAFISHSYAQAHALARVVARSGLCSRACVQHAPPGGISTVVWCRALAPACSPLPARTRPFSRACTEPRLSQPEQPAAHNSPAQHSDRPETRALSSAPRTRLCSWWDDNVAKHEAPMAWAAAFRRVHRREPLVFLDRYCIDPSDISRALVCLPVLVAGCRRCVVLRGPTLLSRLWCLVEIFTFLAMGGSGANVDVVPFGNAPDIRDAQTTERDVSQLDVQYRRGDGRFDARRAQCALYVDYLTLTSVISAFPGGVHALNVAILTSLKDGEACWRAQEEEEGSRSSRRGASVRPTAAATRAQDERAASRAGMPHHLSQWMGQITSPLVALIAQPPQDASV
jgi:hypothetical protein